MPPFPWKAPIAATGTVVIGKTLASWLSFYTSLWEKVASSCRGGRVLRRLSSSLLIQTMVGNWHSGNADPAILRLRMPVVLKTPSSHPLRRALCPILGRFVLGTPRDLLASRATVEKTNRLESAGLKRSLVWQSEPTEGCSSR